MSISPSDSKMPVINPHLKFKVTPIGVVNSPAVYQYSLHDELQLGEDYYKSFLKSINHHQRLKLSEKYPNLKKNISDLTKLILTLITIAVGFRYRHSIWGIKNLCKTPKTQPPKFKEDIQKIWQSIVKK